MSHVCLCECVCVYVCKNYSVVVSFRSNITTLNVLLIQTNNFLIYIFVFFPNTLYFSYYLECVCVCVFVRICVTSECEQKRYFLNFNFSLVFRSYFNVAKLLTRKTISCIRTDLLQRIVFTHTQHILSFHRYFTCNTSLFYILFLLKIIVICMDPWKWKLLFL